jgi:hypothetical protein
MRREWSRGCKRNKRFEKCGLTLSAVAGPSVLTQRKRFEIKWYLSIVFNSLEGVGGNFSS